MDIMERYVPRDCCPRCQEATEPHGALRRLAEMGEKAETMTLHYRCVCGHDWTCNYLAAALGPGWR